MSTRNAMQFAAVMVLAVLAGLLGVQGTWALWSAQVATDAGTVHAADFRVDLNGTPMVTDGVSATVTLTNPTGATTPDAPVYVEVSIKNATNASAPFTILATMGEADVSNTSDALVDGLIVQSAVARGAGCADEDYAATSSAEIGKGDTTTFCVRISLPAEAGTELQASTASITIPVNAAQICGLTMLQPSRKHQATKTRQPEASTLRGPDTSKASKVPAPLRWIGSAVAFVVLSTALLAAAILIVIPFATGSQTYTVLTGSMTPGYPPGTLIVVKPHDFNDLTTGDVVTYQLESGTNTVVTHRIVGFSADQNGDRLLITQGDANNAVDQEPVMEVQVRGKLFYAVPYAGYLANALGHSDRGNLVELVAVGLILYGVVSAGRGVVSKRREHTSSPEPIAEVTE